ncbi:uncharacterized protein UTRI_03049_B [Ustilago trichophora]|uniref:Transcription factor IIIC 90kDa subunit N-terminal domain-containing protein n=1 Tax=Ustilago trichophora TaxID=86804 RepID=A0A5C3E625_9BASI|nr:uncharacterized protein UTRI_03049_B [Ustilago trichophora]
MVAQPNPAPHRFERVRACSIALSSVSSLLGNLKWSDIGQALVVTQDAIVVLSPLVGLHPTLAGQSRAQDVECHPDWDGRFPHSVIQINVKTFLQGQNSVRRRLLLESDHSSVDPRFLGAQWSSASWSKPGMGPHGSCLILATTSEQDLFVLGAPRNAWTGEWQLIHAIELSPVADLTNLDAAPFLEASLHADSDKHVFTQSRALLRKKQMATEVLCASFIHPDQSDAPAYIVAGTRSGHIALWQCQSITGHCTFLSATQVSDTSIQQLILSTQVDSNGAASRGTIAFQDERGIGLCDYCVQQGRPSVRLATLGTVYSHHSMVSAWHWYNHQLIYSTVGKVHVYDVQTAQTISFSLATEPNSSYDPFSPAISISHCSDPQYSLQVVLQDLRVYRIPLLPTPLPQSLPCTLSPIHPPTLSGYPPLTETLQRKHELHQAFLGYQTDPGSSLPSASVVGAVRTDERVAFLGYNVSEVIRYQMEVIHHGNVEPGSILDEALDGVGLATSSPPYLVVCTILACLYTHQQPDAFRDELLSAIEQRWRPLLDASAADDKNEFSKPTEVRNAKERLLYLLTLRLDSSSPSQPASLTTLEKRHKELILRDWLKKSGQSQDAATDESCAACQTPLTLSWDKDQDNFGWARCRNGHVWPRCSVSLAPISDREVRVCTGCWSKSLVPGKPGQTARHSDMLAAATKCLYCGSCWILR